MYLFVSEFWNQGEKKRIKNVEKAASGIICSNIQLPRKA